MDQDPGRDFSVPISASDQQHFSQQPWALITKGSQVCAAMKGERQRVTAAKQGHQYITDNLVFLTLVNRANPVWPGAPCALICWWNKISVLA